MRSLMQLAATQNADRSVSLATTDPPDPPTALVQNLDFERQRSQPGPTPILRLDRTTLGPTHPDLRGFAKRRPKGVEGSLLSYSSDDCSHSRINRIVAWGRAASASSGQTGSHHLRRYIKLRHPCGFHLKWRLRPIADGKSALPRSPSVTACSSSAPSAIPPRVGAICRPESG